MNVYFLIYTQGVDYFYPKELCEIFGYTERNVSIQLTKYRTFKLLRREGKRFYVTDEFHTGFSYGFQRFFNMEFESLVKKAEELKTKYKKA